MKITAVILTKNEENNIEKCLNSLVFCDEIIIVDDFSTDATKKQIDKIKNKNSQLNIKILSRKLNNDFAAQRNFGLEKADSDWVLFIDADEEVTRELMEDIHKNFQLKFGQSQAFFIRRRDFFWGKELKYGELMQIRQTGLVRLVKKNSGRWMGDVHEVFHTANRTGKLKGFLNHYPHQTLKEFISDVNTYSTIRAEELFNHGSKTNIIEIMSWPFFKFLTTYFLRLGFLDGPAGFTYAFMMSFHSFLVRSKLYQLCYKK